MTKEPTNLLFQRPLCQVGQPAQPWSILDLAWLPSRTSPRGGRIYVVESTIDLIKVGRSHTPSDRLGRHVNEAARWGSGVRRAWVSDLLDDMLPYERALIAYARKHATRQHQLEWYEGLEFEAVRDHALSLRGTLTELDPIDAPESDSYLGSNAWHMDSWRREDWIAHVTGRALGYDAADRESDMKGMLVMPPEIDGRAGSGIGCSPRAMALYFLQVWHNWDEQPRPDFPDLEDPLWDLAETVRPEVPVPAGFPKPGLTRAALLNP